MAILKQCSWHGCTRILNDGIKYCNYHQKKVDEEEKKRYRAKEISELLFK